MPRQTHESLKKYLIEETYEAVDAVDSGDMNHLREELGDVLLQVIFHAEIAQEIEVFDIDDVVEGISSKLLRRHPHVFGAPRSSAPKKYFSAGIKSKRAKRATRQDHRYWTVCRESAGTRSCHGDFEASRERDRNGRTPTL